MARFLLVSHWHLDAPIEPVWEALHAVERWPQWWRYVLAVQELQQGDAAGVGALHRYTWTSRLPYQLTFEMRTTLIERPSRLQGLASGELTGEGRWSLQPQGSTTVVRYEWHVATTKVWMNLLSPLLAPAFAWNHGQVMAAGGRGLAALLGVRLLALRPPAQLG